jgi:hypothetical protein
MTRRSKRRSPRRVPFRSAMAVALLTLTAAACSSSTPADDAGNGITPGSNALSAPTGPAAPHTRVTAGPGAITFKGTSDLVFPNDPARCEMFGDNCLLPFPSDHFTRADDTSDTKRRVNLTRESMPANQSGIHIDPTEWNRQDGFSPGSMIIVHVPGIDLAKTGAAPVTDISTSLDPGAPIVLLDTDTGERVPYYAELDSETHAPTPTQPALEPTWRALLIRPARNFADGHRIDVALRHLVDRDGATMPPDPVFVPYRDLLNTGNKAFEDRRPEMEDTFAQLADAGVARDDLYLAWSFTVASTRNLTERVLHMRDDAFTDLGDKAPTFEVRTDPTMTTTTTNPAPDAPTFVDGTFDVPNYLTDQGKPGSVLNNANDPNGIPKRDGVYHARFLCVIPAGARQAPAMGVVYGHGLLGSAEEVKSVGSGLGDKADIISCATDEIGMSTLDIGSVASMLGDLSGFRIMPDRLQQSLINELFLGRLLKSPKGFRTDKRFQTPGGASLLSDEVAYAGNSQGGILGGAVSAIAQDWTKVFLGVPGMNYSTLLNRSVDFDKYANLLRAQYPDPTTQQIAFDLIQMLWDRGENDGYANHLTHDPLPNTPVKQVLLFAAFGDHQVTNVTTDVLARTLGSHVRQPALSSGRSTDVAPFWGIEAIDALPSKGNGYVMWDFGTPAPPISNTPNREGKDPHGSGGGVPEVVEMVTHFLTTGEIIDVCAAKPCHTES